MDCSYNVKIKKMTRVWFWVCERQSGWRWPVFLTGTFRWMSFTSENTSILHKNLDRGRIIVFAMRVNRGPVMIWNRENPSLIFLTAKTASLIFIRMLADRNIISHSGVHLVISEMLLSVSVSWGDVPVSVL